MTHRPAWGLFYPQHLGRAGQDFCHKRALCPTTRHCPAVSCTRRQSFYSTQECLRSKRGASVGLLASWMLLLGSRARPFISHPAIISHSTWVVSGTILHLYPRPMLQDFHLAPLGLHKWPLVKMHCNPSFGP